MTDEHRCQWCAEPVAAPGLCEQCQDEPDAVEFQQAADKVGVPRTTVLTLPLRLRPEGDR